MRRRGINISKFWAISQFQHRCSTRAGKQQFQWRKRIANFTSTKCKWQQFKLTTRNLTRVYAVYGVTGWRRQRKMTSTDLGRTVNAPTWPDFNLFHNKELTTKVYKTKRSSTECFISSITLRDEEMWSRPQISFWRFEDKKTGEGGGEGKGEEETRSGKIRIETSADWLFHNVRESSTRVLFLSLAVPKTRQRRFIELKEN